MLRLKNQYLKAQTIQVKYANKRRREHSFEVGDLDLLDSEHTSIAAHVNRPSKKLEPKFIGPYKIKAKINPNAFELDLPSDMTQHPVFNVSRLKPYRISDEFFGPRLFPPPEPELLNWHEGCEVENVLDIRYKNGKPEYLVKWKGYYVDDSSWVKLSDMEHAKDAIADFNSGHKDSS